MSRSRRKTPIIPMTLCRSERRDKQCWHRAWRRAERNALTALLSDRHVEAHLPWVRNDVSDVWTMSKDGRTYWSAEARSEMAAILTEYRGSTPRERASLRTRLLHRWMAK